MPKKKTVGVKWVTKDEFDAIVDSRAKRVLGISSKQFISRWNRGFIVNSMPTHAQGPWN